ncbi:hypothetical protein I4F81_012877 [Pyropia yezoensis]|uniref:Uncharacterized protein n=1 Tax=Pyropia yezoensis TaxID=2788 RepID=A0ACC3CKA3_PYRYE|nr:hypothetical protein I4F81_012877 [Neopyropia yezoensis]
MTPTRHSRWAPAGPHPPRHASPTRPHAQPMQTVPSQPGVVALVDKAAVDPPRVHTGAIATPATLATAVVAVVAAATIAAAVSGRAATPPGASAAPPDASSRPDLNLCRSGPRRHDRPARRRVHRFHCRACRRRPNPPPGPRPPIRQDRGTNMSRGPPPALAHCANRRPPPVPNPSHQPPPPTP